MSELEAVRRLVKSPPELWAQCSDPLLLAKHLSGFGEITITRLEPESTVAWEGESACGTVELEVSGWGTRVRLTAEPPATTTAPTGRAVPAPAEPSVTPAAAAASAVPTPAATAALSRHAPAGPRGLGALLGAFLGRRRGTSIEGSAAGGAEAAGAPDAGSSAVARAGAEPVPSAAAEPGADRAPIDLAAELEAALDSLGQAHHRPYSRS